MSWKTRPVRKAVKAFADWPTIPQLYVEGTFIGGCDIVLEMHKTGELRGSVGHPSRRSAAPANLIRGINGGNSDPTTTGYPAMRA